MDPSIKACKIVDSFVDGYLNEIPTYNDEYWIKSPKEQVEIKTKFSKVDVNKKIKPKYVNIKDYEKLVRAKDAYSDPKFIEARDYVNPFENIGRSIFMNRAGVKLANIDAVFKVSFEEFGVDKMESNKKLTFCDIAGGPGAFTQYLQYRYPKSYGYGISIRSTSENLNWNTNLLKLKNFDIYYGDDNTGNLYTNWENFIDHVLDNTEDTGVDLVVADGGIDVSEGQYDQQEFLSSRLLIIQVCLGISCCRSGGNFVVKVFDTVSEISAQTIYLLSLCFKKITIFKPSSSRPANSERYIVCIYKKNDIEDYYNTIYDACLEYTDDQYLESFLDKSTPIPDHFVKWLTNLNNLSIKIQTNEAVKIIKYFKGEKISNTNYNIVNFLKFWNLPSYNFQITFNKNYLITHCPKYFKKQGPAPKLPIKGRQKSK